MVYLLVYLKGFDELLELAEQGDHRSVDMLVKDIYGGEYPLMSLPADLIASSFGKAARSVRDKHSKSLPFLFFVPTPNCPWGLEFFVYLTPQYITDVESCSDWGIHIANNLDKLANIDINIVKTKDLFTFLRENNFIFHQTE